MLLRHINFRFIVIVI